MKSIKISIIACVALLAINCGDETSDPLAAAWQSFVDGDYAAAHSGFSNEVSVSPGEARVGLGWTTMKMDSLPQSDAYFAAAAGDSLVHGYAGWAIVGWVRGNHANSITRADFVLRKLPDFAFDYDTRITEETMILVQAYDYYHLGNLASCITKIQALDPSFPGGSTSAQALTKLTQLSQDGVNGL